MVPQNSKVILLRIVLVLYSFHKWDYSVPFFFFLGGGGIAFFLLLKNATKDNTKKSAGVSREAGGKAEGGTEITK